MPKYKIVTDEPVNEPYSGPIVELRLVEGIDGPGPEVQARNPGHKWKRVVRFKQGGKLMLSTYAGDVAGLQTNTNGEIVTF